MESYYMWVGALLIIALTLKYFPSYLIANSKVDNTNTSDSQPFLPNTQNEDDSEQRLKMKEFSTFQTWYIVIFLLVMLADWMQGPYVYKLYSSYNIPTQSIAVLFVIGFGTSGITGAFIGSLADKFGRKKMCILFCILYALCCLTKHFHDFEILLIGRFLGGISTSILFSCFEAWMVTTHHHRGYPSNTLGDTFEKAWSLNSFIAILAGIITSYAVQYYEKYDIIKGGPYEIAAFDCSAVTLLCALIMLNWKWKHENYGDTRVNLKKSLQNSRDLFVNDKRVLLVGAIQSGFESAMYLFVFMWTMALESTRKDGSEGIDHGMIFAVFMESCLVGTTLCGILSNVDMFGWNTEQIACYLCFIGAIALVAVPYTDNYEIRLLLFIIFEGCVGIYFPTIGRLRGKYVPDNVRATIMNIFRIPLNIIVVAVLWYIDELGLRNVFILASLLLLGASVAAMTLNSAVANEKKKSRSDLDIDQVTAGH